MPETPIPTSTRDCPVSPNLFVEADPDLDLLAQSTADESARSDRGRRRGRGLVVLVERYRAPHRARAHDAERFTRPNGNAARWRTAACRAIGHADAAAGRLLGGLATRPYRALLTIVALTLLLFAFSWLVVDVRDMSTARGADNGRLRSRRHHDQTPAGEDRGSHHRAPAGLADGAPSCRRARHSRSRWMPVPGRRRASRRPPAATNLIADRYDATAASNQPQRPPPRSR